MAGIQWSHWEHAKEMEYPDQWLAFFTIKSVEAILYNEKSKAEANCILQYGPVVKPPGMHPFLRCGATPMKRGVWIWPDLQPG